MDGRVWARNFSAPVVVCNRETRCATVERASTGYSCTLPGYTDWRGGDCRRRTGGPGIQSSHAMRVAVFGRLGEARDCSGRIGIWIGMATWMTGRWRFGLRFGDTARGRWDDINLISSHTLFHMYSMSS